MADTANWSFLPKLDADQQILIQTIGLVYLTKEYQWPRWQWVDETLERTNLDAAELLASLPRSPGNVYGYTVQPSLGNPAHDARISLTLAGLSTLPIASSLVDEFLAFLRRMGAIRSTISLDPFSDERLKATRLEIAGQPPFLVISDYLLEMMRREPATWHCERVDITSENWSLTLPSELRRFANVNSIEDYFTQLDLILGPAPSYDSTPRYQSPFTLPAAIDYLDVVWKLKFGEYLVTHVGLERSARLADDIATPEELDSCLSALAELFKGLKVSGKPGLDGHPLIRLSGFLKDKLSEESYRRVENAVEIMNAARTLRHAGQHYGSHDTAPGKWAIFGIDYPIFDWPSAWRQIQTIVAGAVDAIRSEIQGSLEDAP